MLRTVPYAPTVQRLLANVQPLRTTNYPRFGTILRQTSATNNSRYLYSKCIFRAMATSSGDQARGTNRLAMEKSPYLLQHANNPVDWYPWGREAFEKARAEDKLIFLSVGYSTCHWCHVMEHESFEDQEIGDILNEYFVSIKVDREERLDVDKVYMTFIQATSGGGGWPMSVWLTPDLKPIVGGTYFPPDGKYEGRPGFKTILLKIASEWAKDHKIISEKGTSILDTLLRHSDIKPVPETVVDINAIYKCFQMFDAQFDKDLGGFGKEPKFPQPVNLNFLMRLYAFQPASIKGAECLKICGHTLNMMAKGGIHDHIAQGFHRYSTDREWHVPHFEKMLYDQGQLTVAYVNMYQITKDEAFAEMARDILMYMQRDLSHKSGGFYSAEDADSLPTHNSVKKTEGAFCVWTEKEARSLLTDVVDERNNITMADVVCSHYNIKPDGNVDPAKDAHGDLAGQNVLIVRGSVNHTAMQFDLTIPETNVILHKGRKILHESRLSRPKPHLDNKIITAWNGLAISAFAKAGAVLGQIEYIERATEAARFLQQHMYNSETGVLLRSSYVDQDGNIAQIPNPINGFADDYSYLIRSLLDLYESCYDISWLEWAAKLQRTMDSLFWDKEFGGYFTSAADDSSIVMRLKEDADGAEPSANSVAASNLYRLSHYFNDAGYSAKAQQILNLFADRLNVIPMALPEMLCSLFYSLETQKQIIIQGDPKVDTTKRLLEEVHQHYIPNKVLIVADGNKDNILCENIPILNSMKSKDGQATAYVCENYTCAQPVNTAEELHKLLIEKS
ncbi:unnamed protein product [Owenia fusiformis]|uniref:Spermatogenesis-associated protein 20-like TRX domain-containing protein n=1 Tax=Owenia fusiformis TaxID=6347 RepID=A0A8S4PRB1_OWEFU|nr:unnamed protein product [Owenia fusiformis]